MKPISARPIFTLSFLNPKTSHNFSFFSTSSQNQTPVANYSPRRYEEESRSVRVSVWWDFENCNIPSNSNVFRVAQCVTNAVRVNGIKGPIQITAFGDVLQISRNNQEALSSTGINFIHVPSGGKNSADRSLLVDLMYWVTQNPPPAHLFLISGDRDFSGILHRLRMNNYNILLASPQNAPAVLCSAATLMWQWNSLLKGDNLTGKLFNQPPDGPYSSWYGHYKAPLEDPFAITEQLSKTSTEQLSKKITEQLSSSVSAKELLSSEAIDKCPVPKGVVNHIQQILNSFPEGRINISVLRTELDKTVTLAKDLYGYRNFSGLLAALTDVLKIESDNGAIYAHGVNHGVSCETVVTCADGEVTPTSEVSSDENLNGNFTELPVQQLKAKVQAGSLVEDTKGSKKNKPSPPVNAQAMKTKETSGANNSQELKKEKKFKDSSPQRNIKEIRAYKVNLQRADKEESLGESFQLKNMQGVKVETSPSNLLELEKEVNPKESSQQIEAQDKNVDSHQQPKKVEVASPPVENEEFSEVNQKDLNASKEHNAVAEPGVFRRSWNKWLYGEDSNSNEKIELLSEVDKLEENQTMLQSDNKIEKICEEVNSKVSSQQIEARDEKVDFQQQPKQVEVVSQPVGNEEFSEVNEMDLNASDNRNAVAKPGFFRRLRNKWFKGEDGNSSEKHDLLSGVNKVEEDVTMLQSDSKSEIAFEEVDNVKVHCTELELFSKESFWSELGSFLDTSGSKVILQSTSRNQLAQNLKKQGPSSLRNLSEYHLLHLVHVLISDKKWVQEIDSPNFPFKLFQPTVKDNKSNVTPNGLSHIFSGRKTSLQELVEKKNHTSGVSPRIFSSRKTRSEILKDVQKLLDDHIKKDYPEGFPLDGFRKLFIEKNGYTLDLQKLGYDKLANIIQIMPGVRISKSNLILPIETYNTHKTNVRNQETKVGPLPSNFPKRDSDSESSWEELGPLDNSAAKKNEGKFSSGFSKTLENRKEQKLLEYEPLKEDEFTDSDEDEPDPVPPVKLGSGVHKSSVKLESGVHKTSKPMKDDSDQDDDDSSLLQILGSWHENEHKEEGSELVVTKSQASPFANGGLGNAMRKHNKSFSFVADEEDSKDKMVDGILESFKKSSDKSVESAKMLG